MTSKIMYELIQPVNPLNPNRIYESEVEEVTYDGETDVTTVKLKIRED